MAGDSTQPECPLRRFLEGVLGDDGVGVLDQVTTADVTFEAVTGDAYEGREVIKEVLAESMAAYESFDLEIDWIVADGDRLVASTQTTASSRRGILGIPPAEDTRTIDTIFDARLEDGRIAYLRQVFDTRQMMPRALRRGRGAALEQMRDAVVVLDERELVVDANAAAFELLNVEREAALGESIDDVLDGVPASTDLVDESTDSVEIERQGCIYELQTSPIFADEEGPVGHTLVARDVTERERRTRVLAEQRDELERLSELNSVLRGVNQALVTAQSREKIESAVCDRLADTDLYVAASIGDVRAWDGDAESLTVSGDRDPSGLSVPALSRSPAARSDGGVRIRRTFDPSIDSSADSMGGNGEGDHRPTDASDTWLVVPLFYGTTVYGGLALCTERPRYSDRERDVLLELGETIGHAINALETRRLLSADATVSLEFTSTDDADPLAVVTGEDTTLELDGLIPAGEGRTVVYLTILGDEPAGVAETFASVANGAVRTVREDDEWTLEWTLTGDVPLRTFVESGGIVRSVEATRGTVTYDVEVACDADVRSLVDRVRRRFPEVSLQSKTERFERTRTERVLRPQSDDLTQRQREVLEAAYRSGYFSWPRDTTAEEVAESMDIAPSTLHSHLRKAEAAVVESFFDP